MTTITKEVLQEELHKFADTILKRHFADLADLIRQNTRNDFGEFFHNGDGVAQTAPKHQRSPDHEQEFSPGDKASARSDLSNMTQKVPRHSLTHSSIVTSFEYLDHVRSLTKRLTKSEELPPVPATPNSTTTFEAGESDSSSNQVKRTKNTLMGAPSQDKRIQQLMVAHQRNRRHDQFEVFMNGIILLNAAYIGISTEYLASTANPEDAADHTRSTIPELYVIEWLFWIVFTVEVMLKLAVYKLDLFRNPMSNGLENFQRYWNIFDCVVLAVQFFDLILEGKDPNGIAATMRVLRVFRMLRIVRAFKLVRFIRGIRAIVHSLLNSLNLFLWSLVALLLVTYLWAIYFTETVRRYKLRNMGADFAEMDKRFGSMWKSQLSLIQSVTGGVDWNDVMQVLEPLDSISGTFPFLFYVMFAVLAMMNVVTGNFLDTASKKATEESDRIALTSARETFAAADVNQSGTISWPDFEKVLQHKKVEGFFKEIDLDVSEGKTLFDLLDSTGDGNVSANEFLGGCLRACGPAKALDVLVLSREVSQLCDRNNASIQQNREMILKNSEATNKNYKLLCELRAIMDEGKPQAVPTLLPPKLPSSQSMH